MKESQIPKIAKNLGFLLQLGMTMMTMNKILKKLKTTKSSMAKNRIGDLMIQKEKNKLLAMMLKKLRIN